MDSLLDFCGLIFGTSLFIAPYSNLVHLKKKQSNDNIVEVNLSQYSAMFLSALLWFTYGILIQQNVMMITNLLGALAASYYLYFCYSNFPTIQQSIFSHVTISLFIYIGVLVYILFVVSLVNTSAHMGFICCVATIVMFASPLFSFKQIISKRNSDSISLFVSLVTIANCLTWVLNATLYLNHNPFIFIPNFIGLLLGLLQLYLKWKYPSSSTFSPV